MTTITETSFSLADEALVASQVERSERMGWLGPVSAYASVIGLAVGGYGVVKRNRALALAALGGTLGYALFRWQFARYFTERSAYRVESRIGQLEVRRYAPTVRAETTVANATWSEALNEGFERIAGYIFGGNAQQSKIEMTTPVIASIGQDNRARRTVSFLMPGNRPLSQLPTPNDSRVRVREVPAQRVAVLAFRGRYGGELPAAKRSELLRLVHAAGLATVGEVQFAGYDAPSTLPFLRRNEVLVEVT